MADNLADTADNDEQPNDYVTERQLACQRFIELGGGRTIQMDLEKMPKLADCVTPQHRDMVLDLAMSGISHETSARLMGISKERLQALFEYELGVGFEQAKASLIRSLYLKGVAGSETAAINWLKHHNKSDWASKLEKTEKGAAQDGAEIDKLKEAGGDLLTKMLTAMSTDKSMFKKPTSDKLKPVAVLQSDKPKPVKAGATLKKPKGD